MWGIIHPPSPDKTQCKYVFSWGEKHCPPPNYWVFGPQHRFRCKTTMLSSKSPDHHVRSGVSGPPAVAVHGVAPAAGLRYFPYGQNMQSIWRPKQKNPLQYLVYDPKHLFRLIQDQVNIADSVIIFLINLWSVRVGLGLYGPRGSRGKPTRLGLQGPRRPRGRPTGSQRVKG